MRTSARTTGAVAATAAAALLVGGCGSGDDGKGDGGASKADEKKSAAPAPDKSEEPAGEGRLPGVWRADAEGQKLTLTVVDDAASLLRGKDKKVCTGRVMAAGADKSLVLKCPAGVGEERATGKVGTVTATSMKVTWNGGVTDTYTRAADAPAKLPKDPDELGDLPDKLPENLPDKLDDVTGQSHEKTESSENGRKVREYPGG
ncbi:hypothetical protein [Streptomyces reniochalinae]|uniref:hypothetical protein n=1 Tax=Streptomyces reniochalinae TaxID=2250578 RepID=UPI0015F08FE5|nr:hypothetical protein [Streptomyces reniochalinae]